MGNSGNATMRLAAGYIRDNSAGWMASIFGHEGQHYLNRGKYSGESLWKDEQSAGRTQLGIGKKIGFRSYDINTLEQWIDDKNRARMQRHMEQGYSY